MIARFFASLSFIALFTVFPATAKAYDGYDDGVECSSEDFSRTRCSVPWRDARLVEQLSKTSCIRGRTWGIDRRGLWVDGGCAGIFEEAGGRRGSRKSGHGGGGWRPGPEWDSRFSITCESRDYRYHFCAVDVGSGGNVNLEDQISDSSCIEGRTWGWNRAGVWVKDGCGGYFEINRRWRR